ncbi:MAG: hypothetical protein ACOY0T_14915 [Myxococcota bacterium]
MLLPTAAVLSACLALAALVIDRIPDVIPTRLHLGAEYYNIALSISDGRGFSDPFGEPTGPTAWMPPLYPYLLAALLRVAGDKHAVATAILVLMNATIVVVGVTLRYIIQCSARRLAPAFGIGFFALWVGVFHYWYLALTSDVWLLLLVTNFLVLLVFRYVRGRFDVWGWGLVGGVASLVSPALAASWGALSAWGFFRDAAQRRRWLLAGALALAMAVPWAVRNAAVMGSFVPVKSNAGYEMYQGNCVDTDGIYSIESMMKHPFNDMVLRSEYGRLGELEYVRRYRERFARCVSSDPGAFLSKLGNRLLAASVQYVPLSSTQHGPFELWMLRLVYPLPFIALLLGLLRRGCHTLLLRALLLLHAVYLLPYAAIAIYIRYLLPMTPALCLFVYLSVDQLLERRSQATASVGGLPASTSG